jgi:predicted Zn-ribbon and HTH transcriptional regulator
MGRTRKHKTSLTDRSTLESTGERSVGRYAERVRRRRMGIAAGGLALVAVAGLLYYWLAPGLAAPVGGSRRSVMVRCIDPACGYEGVMAVPLGQVFPVQCPKCKMPTCKELWACGQCGYRFFPDQSDGEHCPKCKSAQIGTALQK